MLRCSSLSSSSATALRRITNKAININPMNILNPIPCMNSPLYLVCLRSMANREQRSKDKANMEKKQEKSSKSKGNQDSDNSKLPSEATMNLDHLEAKFEEFPGKFKADFMEIRVG